MSAKYTYDGDGVMVKAVVNGAISYYPGRHYNKVVDGTSEKVEKYYFFASLTVAMRVIENGTDTLQWLLADHLGSTSVTALDDGTLNSILKYSAFGEIWASSGTTLTDYRYTDQLSQAEIGLYYYNARWYDPALGRFVQADTIVPGAGNSGAWDRYAYVINNPINNIDPSGHDYSRGCPVLIDGEYCSPNYLPSTKNANKGTSTSFFDRIPIDPESIDGVQWFGGTQNGYQLMQQGNNIYSYCLYGHCGIDILAPYGTPIYAGVYGKVVRVYSIQTGPHPYEGPYKIIIKVGNTYITYGHTDGTAFVSEQDFVTPNTIISGVGNMGGAPNSGQFNHLHLEARSPSWSGGASLNPLDLMSSEQISVLAIISINQADSSMSHFTDGISVYDIYNVPRWLNPPSIWRTNDPDKTHFYTYP